MMSYHNDLQYQCFDIGDISDCCEGLGANLVEIIKEKFDYFILRSVEY